MLSGEDLRVALLNEFATPEFLTVVAKRFELKGVKSVTAYAAAKKLVADKRLLPAGSALNPTTGRMQPKYANPAAQVNAAAASTLSAQPGSTSERQHRKPNTLVKVQAAKARPQTNAPVQMMTGALQMPEDNESDICLHTKALGHDVSDYRLRLRELSQCERIALVRLAQMISENVEEPAVTGADPATVVRDGQRVAEAMQPERAADEPLRQSA